MAIEEKAKAYDEALEKAKIEINTKGIGETVNLCKQLFPELAESEDERIRKELKEAFEAYDIESSWNGIPIRSIFAWLEKQKEQKTPMSNDLDEEIERFFDECIEAHDSKIYGVNEQVITVDCYELTARHFAEWGEKQKEQKPNYCLYGRYPNVGRCRWCSAACSARLADVHTDEEKEYIHTIKSIISDFIRDKKPENLAYYQRIYDWLDGRHVPFSCGHENGKSAKSLLALVKEELLKDDVLGRKHLEGYIKGRNDALREMSDFMESHFNPKEEKK